MSKVVRFHAVGGPENLVLVDEEPGAPGKNEVLVKMKAAGLNRAEWLYLHGQYLVAPKLPSRIGVEGAGIIDKLGPGVRGYEVGQEVSITPNMSPDVYGVLGEYALVPVEALAPKAPNVSFDAAAAIWMAYPTAYGGLIEVGGLRAGAKQHVVVSAARVCVSAAFTWCITCFSMPISPRAR